MHNRNTKGLLVKRSLGAAALAFAAIAPWAGALAQEPKPAKERPTRRSTDPPVASKGKLGQELFMAVGMRDLKGVKGLIEQGADVNARNGLEFAPLYVAAATHQPAMMKALLEAGAKPESESVYGTALTFAMMTGHAEGARLLIAKGADVNTGARVDATTPLMMAAQAGNPEAIDVLLKNKAKVNDTNVTEASALTYAARMGHTAAGKMLVQAGAKVDQVDIEGQTPLMKAAMAGHADFVKMLLASGAKVNIRDAQGRTPLMLAASYGGNAEIVKALISANANPNAKDAKGRTAATLASERGFEEAAKLLGAEVMARPKKSVDEAVKVSVSLLSKSMKAFSKGAACISCHQEGLGRMVTASAKSRGLKIDPDLEKAQQGRIDGMLKFTEQLHTQALDNPEVMKQIPLIEIAEVTPGYSWLMGGMAAQGDKPSGASAAMAMVLARQQLPDGSWFFALPRVPMQSSNFTFTALTAWSIKTYGSKAHAAEVEERIGKAKDWLLRTPAKTSDDLSFRLLGLEWVGATAEERKKAIDELLAAQRRDGGWAQMPGMASDAYATGQALYALSVGGGVSPDSEAYRSGVEYLLRTQDDDGSWFVSKRAIPANNYMDAAFPHGESQYASFNATSWAALALLETMPKR